MKGRRRGMPSLIREMRMWQKKDKKKRFKDLPDDEAIRTVIACMVRSLQSMMMTGHDPCIPGLGEFAIAVSSVGLINCDFMPSEEFFKTMAGRDDENLKYLIELSHSEEMERYVKRADIYKKRFNQDVKKVKNKSFCPKEPINKLHPV